MLVNYITVYFKDKERKPIKGFYKDFGFCEGFLRINSLDETQVLYINKDDILTFTLTKVDKN